jgi:hypothetical protein
MQDQGTGSRQRRVPELSQAAMERAILMVVLDPDVPVWTRAELEDQFPDHALGFEAAFNDLRANGVVTVSGDLVKVAHAVKYVNDLDERD